MIDNNNNNNNNIQIFRATKVNKYVWRLRNCVNYTKLIKGSKKINNNNKYNNKYGVRLNLFWGIIMIT